MDPHESDSSEQDPQQVEETQAFSRKRSTRACDQCRKAKGKCERVQGEDKKCKTCALANTTCTFLGPSYKRGPPKGYIHAIEQRWHQVESLLGALLQCPDTRVKGVVSDLRQDDLAREILDRVEMGPYGPSGRRMQSVGATKEDFFASVLKSNEMSHSRDSSRALRQSRVSREIVSSTQDHGLSVVPTKEWQDNLSQSLVLLSSNPYPTDGSYTSLYSEDDPGPASQKRRLNAGRHSTDATPDWSNLYTIDPNTEDEEFRETTNELGQLSLDENQEIRFHGKQSGLHLLSRSMRADDRIEGGIWRLPMARVWPPSRFGLPSLSVDDIEVQLPPIDDQDHLVNLYFSYVHPLFPIIHKSRFLLEYNARKQSLGASPAGSASSSSTYSTPRPEPSQEITPLVLLSMFSIAARFREDEESSMTNGKMWEAGSGYVEDARKILHNVRHSRPSVVQSLILLGYREFGIGSMEQGWLLLGVGIRMAYDLGLNCDSSKWKINGHDLFTPHEIQTRRQIWWSCCLADRYGSLYMGRPVMIQESDYDTPLPDVDPVEDMETWQPLENLNGVPYHPVPSRIMSSFCASSCLSVILGEIISKVYPINPPLKEARQNLLAELESRLDQWYHTLPEYLCMDPTHRRGTPPPQILFLHIRYWGSVLLLHRGFIPNWKRVDKVSRNATIGYRAFDLARAAACQMSSIISSYREAFGLKHAPPFFTSYLLSAGIMHILTLTLRPENVESSMGLQQCKLALKDIGFAWPSAARAWELLNGTHLSGTAKTNGSYMGGTYPSRAKRGADDAFEQESAQYSQEMQQRDPYANKSNASIQPTTSMNHGNGVQDLSTRMMAHMLGLDIPGVEPSTSFLPGYEWWPRAAQEQAQGDPEYMSPIAGEPPYSNEAADPNILLPSPVGTTTPLALPLDWISMPRQPSQQMNDMNMNYNYNFQ